MPRSQLSWAAAFLLFAGAFSIVGCNQSPPKSEAQIQNELKSSAEKHRHRRQRMLDEASITCRDGISYLVGDDYDTHNTIDGGNGGPFVVPYYRNGLLVSCGDISNSLTAKKEM